MKTQADKARMPRRREGLTTLMRDTRTWKLSTGKGRNNDGDGGDSTNSYPASFVQPVGDHNSDHTIRLLLPTGDVQAPR
jgi:hypothetical protein